MTLRFLPLQLLWITLASVDAMSSHFPEHSDGVEVQVTLRLHVIKEFIRAFQRRRRQVLEFIRL